MAETEYQHVPRAKDEALALMTDLSTPLDGNVYRDINAILLKMIIDNMVASGYTDLDVVWSRGPFKSLKDRLDAGDAVGLNALTTALKKIEKGVGDVGMSDLGQDVKTAMTGGSVAVVGDNTVVESNIVNRQVTPIKTNFIDISFNLFNAEEQTIATIKDNYFISAGALYPDKPLYFVTAPIPVKPYTTYSVNAKIWGTLGEQVAINMMSSDGTYKGGHNTQTFRTIEGCAYIQITVVKSLYSLDWIKKNFMIVEGASVPTTYQAPGFFLSEKIKSDVFLDKEEAGGMVKALYLRANNDVLKVNSKYSAEKDVRFTLGKRGVNNIFDFIDAALINNSSEVVSSNLVTVNGSLWSSGTDTFGPHIISAVNNADGDKQILTNFTGGNHGYDGGGSDGQTATGRTSNITFKVEGRTVSNFEGYANNLEVIWTNHIQGNNTKKVDGTGREILKETIRLFFDGKKWQVDYNSEALEDLTYNRYYGLQLVTNNYRGGVRYHTSTNTKWNPNNNQSSNSQDLKCSTITVRDVLMNNYVDISLDKTHGLGTRENLTTAKHSAFHTTDKVYMNLIDEGLNLTTGDCLSFVGSYTFYSID